jgi:hypothetical protein
LGSGFLGSLSSRFAVFQHEARDDDRVAHHVVGLDALVGSASRRGSVSARTAIHASAFNRRRFYRAPIDAVLAPRKICLACEERALQKVQSGRRLAGCSHATVSREWQLARIWLYREMRGNG